MKSVHAPAHIAIACGGTGGHLYPGLAIAEGLRLRRCRVSLLISSKPVDRQAIPAGWQDPVLTLPAVGWQRGRLRSFLAKSWQSYRIVRSAFRSRPPHAVLAMGGFTSAPAVLAGRSLGAATFLHEANYIPGKANRWLAPWVDAVFVHFPATALRLGAHAVFTTGMPVRAAFQPRSPAESRRRFGLDPERPVVLVMGGSQGASGINQLVLDALPHLAGEPVPLQFLHLSGPADQAQLEAAYAGCRIKATVQAFTREMDTALDAASMGISRAGASSLAELAAMKVPAILVPYPFAADNHQHFNARAFVETGAARVLEQREARPEQLAGWIREIIGDNARQEAMRQAMSAWHCAEASENVIKHLLDYHAARKVLSPSVAPVPTHPVSRFHSKNISPVSRRRLEVSAP
jgi:UDP-N-acetylglucosamine--N-acetylmuramyl-(pentapeptide) pyrophosphoryl-undecaprenol N-acetylglucosamine transferase